MLHEQSEEAKEENNDTMEMNSMVAGSDMQLSQPPDGQQDPSALAASEPPKITPQDANIADKMSQAAPDVETFLVV